MLPSLRILMIIVSVIVMVFVFRKIRKSHFVIEDSFYWILLCVLLLVFSIFPKICYSLSDFLGFEAPSNFIFLVIIFLLLAKVFFLSVKISKLQTKLDNLVQRYAIDSHENVRKGKKNAVN
ncbi:MAG: DUF2304 domain-containing protein [Clostridia bacterium]|nr:DUF2304 domain-containing protein [Clostridia bacterium]